MTNQEQEIAVTQLAQEVEVSVVSEPAQESESDTEPQFNPEQQIGLIQALLFANSEPIDLSRLEEICGLTTEQIQTALTCISESLKAETSGIELVEVANKYQLRTKGIFAESIRQLKATAPKRLSTAALETLAIIAYRQPVVKSEMEQIRGVDVSPTLKTLLERNLVRIVGHQPTVGQPALYGTTEEFLHLFGLKSLSELPTLKDIKEFENAPRENAEDSAGIEEGHSEDIAEEQLSADAPQPEETSSVSTTEEAVA